MTSLDDKEWKKEVCVYCHGQIPRLDVNGQKKRDCICPHPKSIEDMDTVKKVIDDKGKK